MKESPLLWVSFVFLLVGIIVSSVGTMNMNRWAREPRSDQALSQALKGYDDRYLLYSYLLPAPHVLLSPMGLYVLTTFGQDGEIRFDGQKFQRDFSIARLLRFMAEEGLGKPFAEADSQIKALQQFLDENKAGEGITIRNIIIFYNPKVKLEVSGAPRPISDPKGLKKAIRKLTDKKLPPAKYKQLQELFDDEWEEF